MGIPAKKLSAFLLNLTLALILLGSSASELPLIEECEGTVAPTLNEDELEAFDGRVAGRPILIAYLGKVYDVSKEADVYGPEGSYSIFAGRACTRAVALPSLKLDDVSDHIADFNEEQRASVIYWEEYFQKKYSVVSKLIPDSVSAREARIERHLEKRRAVEAAQAATARETAEDSSGKVFTVEDLVAFDGAAQGKEEEGDGGGGDRTRPIYVGIGGHVVDVTQSAFLYGPGQPRACFAGRVITRALRCDAEDLERGDDITGLTAEQLRVLRRRVKFFLEKFPKVGVLSGANLVIP